MPAASLGLPGFDSPKLVGPTTQSILAHDPDFVVIHDVPVFPEHSTKAKDGRQLIFDRNALKALCDSCNRRIVATGDYATITIGHTVDPKLVRAGTAKNPPVVGFAGPFKIGLFGPPGAQRWCIFARFRIFKDKADEVRQYPRRSPELWLMDTYAEMFLDPIALLSETPRLDMGLLYSASLHAGGIDAVLVEKYAAAAPAAGNVFVPSERFAAAGNSPAQGEPAMAASADEIVQAVVQALDSLDWVQWTKQQMQTAAAPAAMGTAPAADVNAPPPPAPEDMGDSVPPPADAAAAPPAPAAAAPPPAAPPPAAPAAPPAAAAPPPPEKRSDTEPQKNAAVAPAAPAARVQYSADDDKDDDKDEKDDQKAVAKGPDEDEEDEDDLEPEDSETVEQYRARSRSFRRNRRKGAKMSYSAQQPSEDISPAKAKQILEDGEVNGQPLTEAQRKMFGAAASKENYSANGHGDTNSLLTQVLTRLDTLDKQLASDRAGMKNVERYARLEGLARQGYAIDPAQMIETLRYSADGDNGVSDAEFSRHIEVITKTGNRAPIDAPLLPIPDSVEQYTAEPGSNGKVASADHRATTMALCEKAANSGQKADYLSTLRNVVSGKPEPVLVP